jgi:hypothetical protein
MRLSSLILLPVLALSPLLRAEGPGDKPKPPPGREPKPEVHPHLRAAHHYERQAEMLSKKAAEAPDAASKAKWLEASENSKKLAQMKRDALASEKEGKPYDWKDYQELRGKTAEMIGEGKPMGPKPPEKPKQPKPEPKAEAAPMPEKIISEEPASNPTKMKTKSGFEVKTKLGE